MAATVANKVGKGAVMKTVLGLGLMTALAGVVGAGMAVGWAYEGPRRFVRRLKLRKALR
jgi:hypothetical protein